MHIHLFGMDGFDPADSYGTVIIVVPDPDALYQAGRTDSGPHTPCRSPIPRLVRPRKRWGTVYGFSLVDVGGNWLVRLADRRQRGRDRGEAPGLARILDVAARLADAHGDDAAAMRTLASGLPARRTRRDHAGARAALPVSSWPPA